MFIFKDHIGVKISTFKSLQKITPCLRLSVFGVAIQAGMIYLSLWFLVLLWGTSILMFAVLATVYFLLKKIIMTAEFSQLIGF